VHPYREAEYFIDLVFYNYILKRFALIDLKTSVVPHQNWGRWICMFACAMSSSELRAITQLWEYCCAPTQTTTSRGIPCFTITSSCLLSSNVFACQARRSCAEISKPRRLFELQRAERSADEQD
jgi:hypothetical protein